MTKRKTYRPVDDMGRVEDRLGTRGGGERISPVKARAVRCKRCGRTWLPRKDRLQTRRMCANPACRTIRRQDFEEAEVDAWRCDACDRTWLPRLGLTGNGFVRCHKCGSERVLP